MFSDISHRPYPFDVAQGAMFTSYNEAIAGQGLGALLGTAAGLAVGPVLVNAQGQASGLGWGIAVRP